MLNLWALKQPSPWALIFFSLRSGFCNYKSISYKVLRWTDLGGAIILASCNFFFLLSPFPERKMEGWAVVAEKFVFARMRRT